MSRHRLQLVTTSPDETRRLAAAVARCLRPGDVVSLVGDLGAGKTCFVQGAAAALGVAERVVSPTYVLVRSYDGDVPVVHCDVYRLEHLGELADLGDEPLSPEVVTFVEWGEAAAAVLPDDRLEVELLLGRAPADATTDGDRGADTRRVTLTAGGSWHPRLGRLAVACEPWLVEEEGQGC